MASIWVESVGRSLDQALDLLARAVRDCSDDLWGAAMWPVPEPEPDRQFLGPDWKPITDPPQRQLFAQQWVRRWSTPWSVAWHALEVLDYDLNGEFGPWAPPAPFAGHPHWRDLASLPEAWTPSEVLGYIEFCRGRVWEELGGMTDGKAATPMPPAHRFRGQPRARIITGLVVHTTEHAAQISQFLTSAGIAPGTRRGL